MPCAVAEMTRCRCIPLLSVDIHIAYLSAIYTDVRILVLNTICVPSNEYIFSLSFLESIADQLLAKDVPTTKGVNDALQNYKT